MISKDKFKKIKRLRLKPKIQTIFTEVGDTITRKLTRGAGKTQRTRKFPCVSHLGSFQSIHVNKKYYSCIKKPPHQTSKSSAFSTEG